MTSYSESLEISDEIFKTINYRLEEESNTEFKEKFKINLFEYEQLKCIFNDLKFKLINLEQKFDIII